MIALDAMGGDFAPHATILGAIQAARNGIPIALFGDERKLIPLLRAIDPLWENLSLTLFHCPDVIGMTDEPGKAIVYKKESSLVRAVESVANGDTRAIVSAGNSGAALVAGTIILGRAPGILRPALGDFVPTCSGSIFCIDLGANVDCKPEFLEQFAYMGAAYVQLVTPLAEPRIGLLSNGEEPYKGSQVVKQTYDLLYQSSLNFIGNVQSRDMFDNVADVLVCDGFSGNILLKAMQGTAHLMTVWLKQEAYRSWWQRLYFMLGYSIFKRLKNRADYAKKGGALLLGINYPLVIAHGCSQAEAIEQAIRFAHYTAQEQFVSLFNEQFLAILHKNKIPAAQSTERLRSLFGRRHAYH
jgi:phosphate acyltransferase